LSQISYTTLYEIITLRLGYHKFYARWVPKILADAHKFQRMTSALISSERYHKHYNKSLNQIVRVTGDENWVLFVNAEIKRTVKAVDAHTFTKGVEKV
jgi:hypothetical protein